MPVVWCFETGLSGFFGFVIEFWCFFGVGDAWEFKGTEFPDAERF